MKNSYSSRRKDPIQTVTVADRRMAHDQLQDNLQRDYLAEISVSEDEYFTQLFLFVSPMGPMDLEMVSED